MVARVERRMWTNMPWTLMVVTLLIATMGVYNLVSAGRFSGTTIWASQIIYILVGILAALMVILLDTRFIERMTVSAVGDLTLHGATRPVVFRISPASSAKIGDSALAW